MEYGEYEQKKEDCKEYGHSHPKIVKHGLEFDNVANLNTKRPLWLRATIDKENSEYNEH